MSPNITYCYRVSAYNDAGNSGYTNEDCATTDAISIPPPAAPTNLTATAVSSSQINLNWNDNSNDETGFIIEIATDSNPVYSEKYSVGENVTTFQDMGLTPNTKYDYRVTAYNEGGNSSYSNEVSATTTSGTTTCLWDTSNWDNCNWQ